MAKQKQGLTLPDNVVTALAGLREEKKNEMFADYVALLRNAGWTLASIADPLGLTRERIRQIATSHESLELAGHFADAMGWEIPEVPEKDPRYTRETTRRIIKPSETALTRLRELKPRADNVRWNNPSGRAEAEEYVALMAEEIKRGVSVYALAKGLGLTSLAVRSRLSRYGHLPAPQNGSEKYQSMFAPLKYRA